MAIFVPITSDAGLRHWPFVTISLIVLNTLAFVAQFYVDDPVDYALWHGEGLHPIQWLTSFFMHAGPMHLIGNMIFLWVFGHVVEGVVGHGKFALLYLGMGILQNFIEQVIYLGVDAEPSLGASSAIYAIMLLAAWLAPQSNVQCLMFIFYRFFFFDVPIFMMAAIYFLLDLMHSIAIGFEMSTPWLHAMGGLIGLLVGFVSLKTGWIENEGEDLLTYIRNRGADPADVRSADKPQLKTKAEMAQDQLDRQRQWEIAEKSFQMHVTANNVDAVLNQYLVLRRLKPDYVWQEADLLHVLKQALSQKKWEAVNKLSEAYLNSYQTREVAVRLNWAKILLEEQGKPTRALKVLRPLEKCQTSLNQRELARSLTAECQKQLAEGSLELGD